MERHLDENEIALYVEAIESGTVDGLPEEILGHVEACLECKCEIMAIFEIAVYPILRGHRD